MLLMLNLYRFNSSTSQNNMSWMQKNPKYFVCVAATEKMKEN